MFVAVGVALELIEPINEAVAWIKQLRFRKRELANFREVAEFRPVGVQYRRKPTRSGQLGWLKWFGRIGIILVVLGVIGEAKYGADLEDVHNTIHENDLAKLKAADEKAGEAADFAKTAHDDADAVKNEAASLSGKLQGLTADVFVQ
jgi:hypothetical protein